MATSRRIAAPLYLVGATLLLIPPFDGLMQTLPIRLQDPRWRFGFYGIMMNSMLLGCAGFFVLCATAAWRDHRGAQRALGGLAIASSVFFLLFSGLFFIDIFKVKAEVPPAATIAFSLASLISLTKGTLTIVTLGSLGLAAFRSPKLPAPVTRERKTGAVMVGQKQGVAEALSIASPAESARSAG